jgi:hypothetical protein
VLLRYRSAVGSDLLIQMGKPEELLPSLALPGSKILAQTEVCSQETGVESRLKRRLGPNTSLDLIWGANVRSFMLLR